MSRQQAPALEDQWSGESIVQPDLFSGLDRRLLQKLNSIYFDFTFEHLQHWRDTATDVGIQTLFLKDVIEPSSIVNNIDDNIYENVATPALTNGPMVM